MLVKMDRECAREVASWKYGGKYSLYSFSDSEETVEELVGGNYYAFMTMNKQEIIGYFVVGKDARVDLEEKEIYSEDYIDLHLGLRPDLCGKGLGYNFLMSGMEYFEEEFKNNRFRITVIAKNKRAIKLYEKAGFKEVRRVRHSRTIDEFIVLKKE